MIVAFVVLLVVLVSSGGSERSRPMLALPSVSGPGPESIFEEEAQIHANPVGTLDTLKRLGVQRVRVYIPWAAIAPDPTSPVRPAGFDAADPAAYPDANWAIYDTIVRDTLARRMGLDVLLSSPAPDWATTPGEPRNGPAGVWKPSAAEFGLFVTAVARRYSGSYTPPGETKPLPRVHFWSIWNEPNLGIELAPQAIDTSTIEVAPALYRNLLDAAWSAFQSTGHGKDTILIGELAPAGESVGNYPGNFANMVPLRFLRALYCVDSAYKQLRGTAAAVRDCPTSAAASAQFASAHPALFHASGLSLHPYPQGLPPNTPTPNEPDYAELADLPQVENVLDTLQRVYGSSTRFPIWSTEYGYQTTPPDTEAGTTSPQEAAYYLNWSEYLTWLNPRIRSYDQYLLIDSRLGAFATGLEFANGTPKPGFYAYRMPIYLPVSTAAAGQPLEVWGCARPADFAKLNSGPASRVEIQFRHGANGAFQTVRTVTLTSAHGCYFDVVVVFPGSGEVRTAWSYPSGQTIYSRVVRVSLH